MYGSAGAPLQGSRPNVKEELLNPNPKMYMYISIHLGFLHALTLCVGVFVSISERTEHFPIFELQMHFLAFKFVEIKRFYPI